MPYLIIISGDKYSAVPTKVLDMSSSFSNDLQSPKSINLTFPSLESNIFSGFKSRYLIFKTSCACLIASTTYAKMNLVVTSSNFFDL